MKRKALWAAVPYTVPVMLGYLFLGAAFGVLIAENGFSVLWAFLMSTFIYAGSMQFAAISLMISAFSPVSAADAHGKCKASVLRSFHVKTV